MFTVIALPPPLDPVGESGALEEDTAERAMDELLGEITSSCTRFGASGHADDPPKYETLFSSSHKSSSTTCTVDIEIPATSKDFL